MWLIGSILGSISLILLNTLSKLWCPLSGTNVLILGALSLFTTGCFLYAWQTSPKSFLIVWFIQSGIVSVGSFLANYFVKDSITPVQIMGILSIIGGGYLLVR